MSTLLETVENEMETVKQKKTIADVNYMINERDHTVLRMQRSK